MARGAETPHVREVTLQAMVAVGWGDVIDLGGGGSPPHLLAVLAQGLTR
jgi:hypothetical protein